MPSKSVSSPIPDVDHFEVVEGVGVRGATEKDVLRDPDSGLKFIAKLGGRDNDREVMTEYAIYLIGRSLGVTVAEARIGRFRGRLRFMSQYFLTEGQSEELVHGMQLFHELYDEQSVQRVLHDEDQEQEMFNVQAVKAAFGAHYTHYGPAAEGELFCGFVSMLAHDALIGVQDRHHENWGVIVHRDIAGPPPVFAPLYDSARGLFCNRTDKELARAFGGPQGLRTLDAYVARARPLVGFSGLKPRGRKYITHDQLLAAVFWEYPDQRNRIAGILERYDWRVVRDQLRTGLAGLCSPRRQDLILVCLRRRLRALWRAINAGPDRPAIMERGNS